MSDASSSSDSLGCFCSQLARLKETSCITCYQAAPRRFLQLLRRTGWSSSRVPTNLNGRKNSRPRFFCCHSQPSPQVQSASSAPIMLGRRGAAKRDGVTPAWQQQDGPVVWETKRSSALMIALPLCLGFVLGACALVFSVGPPLNQQQQRLDSQLMYNSTEAVKQEALAAKLVEITAGALSRKIPLAGACCDLTCDALRRRSHGCKKSHSVARDAAAGISRRRVRWSCGGDPCGTKYFQASSLPCITVLDQGVLL